MKACNDRRKILTFPAVQPYSGASTESLLNSLTDLCRTILLHYIHDRRHRYLHRRSFRESLRQVTLLLTFFESLTEETNNKRRQLPPSVILPLTELHVTLQRLRYLLADFSRPGATIWLLMHSETIACELRVLLRAIATCLDILLSLKDIIGDEDVIQIVQMQARQAWKLNISTDSEEEKLETEVKSMIKQLGNGFSPSRRKLFKILDKLELKSWEVCNEEVLFLEEELPSTFIEENGNGGCVGFLSSLIGLMRYCRAVVFFGDGPVEGKYKLHEAVVDEKSSVFRSTNPESLRCPISLELMTDPVTVSTGQTYDRKSIERWLNSQQSSTCPVTGDKLANAELLPNLTLRKLVNRFCTEYGIPLAEPGNQRNRDLSKTESAGSRAAEGAARITIKFLVGKLDSRSEAERNRAAYEIRLMTKSSLFNRACLVESGAVPLLLSLLCSGDPSTQENCVAALLNLSKQPKGRTAIFESGGLNPVLKALTEGYKLDAKQNAVAILFYLSSSEDCRKQIGETPDAIPAIVDLLRNGTYRGKKNAIVALFGLLLHSNNHQKVLAADAVPAITGLLSSEKEDLVNDAAAVLAKLADRPEGAKEIVTSSAVPLLVEVLRNTGSNSGKEYCVSALLSLCNNGGSKVISVLEEMHSLMPSLYRLVTDGSPQAGKKARSLLNHIHRYFDLDGPVFFRPPVRDRMVHAT